MNNTKAIIDDYHSKIVNLEEYIGNKKASHYQKYDKKICEIFSTLHEQICILFDFMNKKSFPEGGHFNADESRELMEVIEDLKEFRELLKDTEYSFGIEEITKKALNYADGFLVGSGGSPISNTYQKINIPKYEPIFFIEGKVINVKKGNVYDLKQIGRGAFATVSKYNDPEYSIDFAVKILNKGSSEREVERFREEYETLDSLNSPYVLQVFSFNKDKLRYVMEFCDMTLRDYYEKNNGKMLFYTRKRIAQQFLYGISYLQHKGILHRDISPNNVLLKQYDAGVIGIKLSDFGLVKNEGSNFTKTDTELKGTIIDPALESLKDYSFENEVYSIGRMLNFIFTGKRNYAYKSDCALSEIVKRCTDSDLSKRFDSIQEIVKEVDLITEQDIK